LNDTISPLIPGGVAVKAQRHLFAVLSPLLLVGCIVGDELTTITIHPDGSAQMVTFRINLRSTQSGQDGQRELADNPRCWIPARSLSYCRPMAAKQNCISIGT
jgi:hypothetical protein